MHEIGLLIDEKRNFINRSRWTWHPTGSASICISDREKRKKWLEYTCEHPWKWINATAEQREKLKYDIAIPGWKYILEAWTPELHEAWKAEDRPVDGWPLGRLMVDIDHPQRVWDAMVEPLGLRSYIPYAPESDVRACDAWLWSGTERSTYLILTNEDAGVEEVEGLSITENVDMDTGEVLPPAPDEGYPRDQRVATVFKNVIDYKSEIGLSPESLVKVDDRDVVINPRFDKPISKSKIRPRNIDEIRGALQGI